MQTRHRSTGPSSTTVEAVLERAQWACELCSAEIGDRRGEDYSVHHRRPRQMGGTRWAGSNSPSNLMLLCGSGTTGCHGVVESHRSGAVAAGWLVLSREDPATAPVLIHRERWVLLTADATYEDVPAPGGVS